MLDKPDMICKPANIALNLGEFIYKHRSCQRTSAEPVVPAALSFTIFTDAQLLPARWDILAKENFFLSRQYLSVLQYAAPANMECHFIGLYKNGTLCGIALAQYLNLDNITIIKRGEETLCLKDYLFKKYASHILIAGNNTITGQNAFIYSDELSQQEGFDLLQQSIKKIRQQYRRKGIAINMIAIKDFDAAELPDLQTQSGGYYTFSTQPNMVFTVRENWETANDYLADLNTKYRTQYNRARKKAEGIEKRLLSAADIKFYEKRVYELYLTVVENASFNTFLLPENHFEVLKKQLGDDFLLHGYFQGDQLAGFSTLIRNNQNYLAYFLGYDAEVQKEKMLYLNMLYDMIGHAIDAKSKKLVFGRSAMEIKSSVGAQPQQVFGFIRHNNPLLNPFMAKLFPYYEPKTTWKERNPYK